MIMTHGKNICNQLKAVRKRIAEENNIPLEIEECTYKGECRGTCPRCEAEVRYLENALAERMKIGKVATIAGLALGLAATTTQAQTPVQHNTLPDSTTRYIDRLMEGEVEDFPDIFIQVDEDPEFPGGIDALQKFIEDSLRYPRLAAENGISGKVYVTFVVNTDGTVQNPRVIRDIGGGCGAEAIRIVKLMPKWKPGIQKGKAVRVQYNLPVHFDKKYCIPLIEGQAPVQGMPIQDVESPIDTGNPNAPSQQMEVEGVKVIVR